MLLFFFLNEYLKLLSPNQKLIHLGRKNCYKPILKREII